MGKTDGRTAEHCNAQCDLLINIYTCNMYMTANVYIPLLLFRQVHTSTVQWTLDLQNLACFSLP